MRAPCHHEANSQSSVTLLTTICQLRSKNHGLQDILTKDLFSLTSMAVEALTLSPQSPKPLHNDCSGTVHPRISSHTPQFTLAACEGCTKCTRTNHKQQNPTKAEGSPEGRSVIITSQSPSAAAVTEFIWMRRENSFRRQCMRIGTTKRQCHTRAGS